jgi:hypothetical protein
VRRSERLHAWDQDARIHARNVAFERELETVLASYASQQSLESDVPGVIAAIYKFGVIPGVMVFLVYLIAFGLQADVRATREMQQSMNAKLDRQDRLQERMLGVMLTQCVNSAANPQERTDCVRSGQQ